MNRHPRTCTPHLFHKNKKNLEYVNKQRYYTKRNAKMRKNKYLMLYDYENKSVTFSTTLCFIQIAVEEILKFIY